MHNTPGKVLIAIPCLNIGGTEMHALALAKSLLAGGYAVTICAYHEHDEAIIDAFHSIGASVRLLSLDRPGPASFVAHGSRLAMAFGSAVLDEHPDFVHVQYMTPGVTPVLTARAMGVHRVLATVHVPGSHYGRRLWVPRSIIGRCCDAFLCVSQAAERSFFGDSALFDESLLAQGRTHFTIHNGIDIDQIDSIRIATDAAALRQSLKLGDDPVIAMTARLSPEKGVHEMLDAMAIIARRIPAARLLMIGDGPLKEQLMQTARDAGIDARITWAGRQPRERAYAHMAVADVVAVPSRWEGFGLAAAEAMALGKPVIASAAGGLKEVVADGITGVLTPPRDPAALAAAIADLLTDAPRRQTMGLAGRDRAQRLFSMKTFADRHLRLYAALCGACHRENTQFQDTGDHRRRETVPACC